MVSVFYVRLDFGSGDFSDPRGSNYFAYFGAGGICCKTGNCDVLAVGRGLFLFRIPNLLTAIN